MPTYEPPSLPEIFGGTATHVHRVYLDVEVGLSVNVLDRVDSRLQLPVFEEGRGITGRVQDHGCRASMTTWETKASRGVTTSCSCPETPW